jgi:TPR repeat protein
MNRITLTLIVVFFIFLSGCQTAFNSYQKGDFSTAFNEWTLLAKKGDSNAQFNLARMYARGEGVTRDDKAAVIWYTRSAEQDYANAQYNLGWMYSKGRGVAQHDKAAVKWYTRAAEQGDSDAQYNLGVRYGKGEGVTQDYKAAVMWYTRAAEQGDSDAQNSLGVRYAKGEGVTRDDKAAVMWYTRAAEQGNDHAQNNLGLRYSSGEGVTKDNKAAVMWFTRAAEQGNSSAQYNLGVRYSTGEGVVQDDNVAHMWYTRAAEQGDRDATTVLANLKSLPVTANNSIASQVSVIPSPSPLPQPTDYSTRILTVQKLLTELGYSPGPTDGQMGNRTKSAIIEFQDSQNGYAGSNGIIDDRLITALNITVQNRPTPQQQIAVNDNDQIEVLIEPNKISLGKRIALVIGNSNYPTAHLANPVNDARLMEKTLKQIGFDVSTEIDSTYLGMKKAIINFGRRLNKSGKDTTGLVFYAGHGIQSNGKNYMIPVDAEFQDEADLEIAAIDANWILAKMGVAQNDLNFLILDACRNNPFVRSFTRSSSRGLGRMDAPRGTMIAYATSPGDVAADGKGRNSPYSLALSKAMLKPNLSANAMFIEARNQVMQATGDKQVPWEEGGLTSQFYFAGLSKTIQQGSDITVWNSIKTDYEIFIQQYPNSLFTPYAQARIVELQ